MQLGTTELILEYVSKGFGVGLGHELPGRNLPKGVTSLALKNTPPLVIGAMWRGHPSPVVQSTLTALRETCASLRK